MVVDDTPLSFSTYSTYMVDVLKTKKTLLAVQSDLHENFLLMQTTQVLIEKLTWKRNRVGCVE